MLEKFSNGWTLVKASAQVLNANRNLLIFPALSSVTLLLVTATFVLPQKFWGSPVSMVWEGPLIVLGVLTFYIVQYTVIVFFNAALVGAAMIHFEGGDPTVGDGLRIAWKHIRSIVGYALIAASVGMILHNVKGRSGFAGKLLIGLAGMAWNLATFLVVPVLVTRDVGPREAIKESAKILKKTWGEQVVGNASIGFVFLVLQFAVVGPCFFLALIVTGSAFVTLVPLMLGLALVYGTLTSIYQAALYRFATVGDAGRFDRRLLKNAFRPKG